MKAIITKLFLCAMLVLSQLVGNAQISLTGTYTQDFINYNGLSGGQPFGWTAVCANYRGQGDGSSNAGGVWSYGLGGNERALGYLGSSTSASFSSTVSFVNN